MNILQRLGFKSKKRNTANLAKERLQIIVSHESHRKNNPDFMKQLQSEIIEVIAKYIHVDLDKIKVQLEHNGDQSVLELNVSMPDSTGYQGIDISVQTDNRASLSSEAAELPIQSSSETIENHKVKASETHSSVNKTEVESS